jgi:transposase
VETPPVRVPSNRSRPSAKKGALVRRLRKLGKNVVVLFEDETVLRLFPPLRAKWAWKGTQPRVRISGANGKRVVFATVNPRTGHRVVMRGKSMRQAEFQAFLTLVHRRYHGHPLALILDEAGCHVAQGTHRLATKLGIHRLYLPKQSPELNPVDHLWRPVKNKIAANRQYETVDEEAEVVERYIDHLTPVKTLRLAGILAEDFWLPEVCKNFWSPT